MPKVLVLYYSFEGNTQIIAELIAREIGADIEAVIPVKELKTKGFSKYIWGGSQVVMKRKPEIKALKSDLGKYDTILLGSPIWAGTFAPPIYTLLENGILKNMRIGYFYCHEGGCKKAVAKAKSIIEKDNVFISAIDCLNAIQNYEKFKEKVVLWAREVIDSKREG